MGRINPLAVSLAALACGVAALALGLAVLLTGDDNSHPSTPAPGESSTAAPETATPSPAAEPEYRAIRVVGDLPWPADFTMLTTTGGYAHGTGTPNNTPPLPGAIFVSATSPQPVD